MLLKRKSLKFKTLFPFIVMVLFLVRTNIVFSQEFDITVTIKGFRNNKGQVLLALHDKANAFPTKPDIAVQKAIVPIQNKSDMGFSYYVQYTFKNVVPGIYAVTSVHDENGNGNMDLFLFRPVEGYGTSNDIRGLFGPPRFHDAKFTVSSKDIQLDINMEY